MDWRAAYLQNVESEMDHLSRLKAACIDLIFEDEWGDTVRLRHADYGQMLYHARREAERSVNEAIHRWNETHE